jgi:hypothetical protein
MLERVTVVAVGVLAAGCASTSAMPMEAAPQQTPSRRHWEIHWGAHWRRH